jgi:poly(A) polymerase
MRELAPLLAGVPPARLFDECCKLFLSGHGVASLARLRDFELLPHLFPAVAEELERDPDGLAARLVQLGLENTDARVAEQRAVTPTFLFAFLLYGPILRLAQQRRAEAGLTESQALLDAADAAVMQMVRRVAVPKRFTLPLRELIALQPRFERRDGRRALALLHHPRFRGAYDFLVLRARAGEVPQELADWWTEIQELPAEERQQRVEALAPVAAESPTGEGEGAASAPRRRRRRRGRGGGARPPEG